MKKGLSVLLIAAALFGFYGGAVNLQDVLACMHYWEKEGERTTADMNKLEDGLKQLQDNEQAYLDGADQLAEGEKTLAEGEAAYAAAPAQLAAGQAQLDEGYDSFNNLKKLISGLNTAKLHGTKRTGKHDKYWHDGFTFNTYKQNKKAGLKSGRQMIVATLKDQAETVALLETLTGASNLVSSAANATSYANFDNVLNKKLYPAFSTAAVALRQFAALADAKGKSLTSAAALIDNFGAYNGDVALQAATAAGAKEAIAALTAVKNGLIKKYGTEKGTYIFSNKTVLELVGGTVQGEMKDFLDSYEEKLTALASGNADMAMLLGGMQKLRDYGPDMGKENFVTTANAVGAGLSGDAKETLEGYAKTAQDSADTFKAWDDGYNTLLDGQKELGSKTKGIPYAFKNMVTNKTIKAAIKQYDPKLMSILRKYTGSRLKSEDMDKFDSDIVYLSKSVIPRCLSVLAKVKASAAKQLADGERQLAEGKASYAAAPAQLADGRKQLADGREQLAQYEDGEQQVRDGLATLMSTEPSGGLESILDRRNGDDDFDNGDEHLELAEGLDAVDVGRGYQADSGELITAELVKRGAGTAAAIAAGVLALLAALLSFLRKNKGAAISACIAAIAAAGGAAVGTSAGTEFSAQAGSVVGALPWAAAGTLAAIAVVFAVVHFSNPKEAK